MSQTTGNLYIARTNASDLGNYSCLATSHMDFSTKSVFSKFAQLNLAAEGQGQGTWWGAESWKGRRTLGKEGSSQRVGRGLTEPRVWGLDPWVLLLQGPRPLSRPPGRSRGQKGIGSEPHCSASTWPASLASGRQTPSLPRSQALRTQHQGPVPCRDLCASRAASHPGVLRLWEVSGGGGRGQARAHLVRAPWGPAGPQGEGRQGLAERGQWVGTTPHEHGLSEQSIMMPGA